MDEKAIAKHHLAKPIYDPTKVEVAEEATGCATGLPRSGKALILERSVVLLKCKHGHVKGQSQHSRSAHLHSMRRGKSGPSASLEARLACRG